MEATPFVQTLVALIAAPLLPGIIHRVKAWFAGRKGQPLLQLYHDLWKLLHKGAVYSRTTTVIFRWGPLVVLASILLALVVVPFGGGPAILSFQGDLLLFAYILGLARFFIVVAALDTGSSFEGMGGSREVFFSALAEPALLLGLTAVARVTGKLSLADMFASVTPDLWLRAGPALLLVTVALLVVFLAENSRIPFDDPNTHLELTMIHEVMILDHGGPDLAFLLYGASLKLWVLGALLVNLLLPLHIADPWLNGACFLAGMMGMAAATGVIESVMARLQLTRVPQLLLGADALAAFAIVLVLR